MARFEVSLTGGERILVDHAAPAMQQILDEVTSSAFILFSEVKGGSSTPARDVIVATRQITLIRPLGDRSTQGTDFKPKR
jgi:hypothetical protein